MSSLAVSSNPVSEFEWQDFWRFVQVQQTVAAAAQLLIEYPPILVSIEEKKKKRKKIEEMIKHHERQWVTPIWRSDASSKSWR
jgi:hypothetical protein